MTARREPLKINGESRIFKLQVMLAPSERIALFTEAEELGIAVSDLVRMKLRCRIGFVSSVKQSALSSMRQSAQRFRKSFSVIPSASSSSIGSELIDAIAGNDNSNEIAAVEATTSPQVSVSSSLKPRQKVVSTKRGKKRGGSVQKSSQSENLRQLVKTQPARLAEIIALLRENSQQNCFVDGLAA